MFFTEIDAIVDVDEDTKRDNTGVVSFAAIVELLSELFITIFVDEGTRFAELSIDDTSCNNVVWLVTSFVWLILFTFVVEYNSVLSDTRLAAISGELL